VQHALKFFKRIADAQAVAGEPTRDARRVIGCSKVLQPEALQQR
jgi:hypothetical protein